MKRTAIRSMFGLAARTTLLLFFISSGSAFAQYEELATTGDVAHGGDEGGSRAKPVRLEVAYIGDVVAALHGGRKRGGTYLDNVDVLIEADLERVLGWRKTTLFLYGLGNQGGRPSSFVGDVQGTNNIEAVNAWRVYEAFLQRRFIEQRLSILAGLYDVNSEFDALESAAVFVNSSFGMGADFALSRSQGPSTFPFTSLGMRARGLPHENWFVQFAALDGMPGDPGNPRGGPFQFGPNDGLLLVAESGLLVNERGWEEGSEAITERLRRQRVSRVMSVPYRGKISAGIWYYTARFDPILNSSERIRGNLGAYALGEWLIVAESDDSREGLHVFARVGAADERVNCVAAYTGAGLVYTGLFEGRDADRLGLGVAIAHLGESHRRQRRQQGIDTAPYEQVVELTYLSQLTPWLATQIDLQFVRFPDAQRSVPDALVGAIRLHVSLGD